MFDISRFQKQSLNLLYIFIAEKVGSKYKITSSNLCPINYGLFIFNTFCHCTQTYDCPTMLNLPSYFDSKRVGDIMYITY